MNTDKTIDKAQKLEEGDKVFLNNFFRLGILMEKLFEIPAKERSRKLRRTTGRFIGQMRRLERLTVAECERKKIG